MTEPADNPANAPEESENPIEPIAVAIDRFERTLSPLVSEPAATLDRVEAAVLDLPLSERHAGAIVELETVLVEEYGAVGAVGGGLSTHSDQIATALGGELPGVADRIAAGRSQPVDRAILLATLNAIRLGTAMLAERRVAVEEDRRLLASTLLAVGCRLRRVARAGTETVGDDREQIDRRAVAEDAIESYSTIATVSGEGGGLSALADAGTPVEAARRIGAVEWYRRGDPGREAAAAAAGLPEAQFARIVTAIDD